MVPVTKLLAKVHFRSHFNWVFWMNWTENLFCTIKYEDTVEIRNPTAWNKNFLKIGFQMAQFSNGRALATMAIALVPTIWKMDHSKSERFCLDFKWFLTNWWPFVQILSGWASRFKIPFQIQTICNDSILNIFLSLRFSPPIYYSFS